MVKQWHREDGLMRIHIVLVVLVLSGCVTRAKTDIDRNAKIYPPNNGRICLIAGAPPSDIRYETLGHIVASKRSYGSSEELYAPMAYEGRRIGADAIIGLQASQRFKGPLPWRVAAPTGYGVAIKLIAESPPLDCAQAGGRSY